MHFKKGTENSPSIRNVKFIYILCATRASNEQSCPLVALNSTKAEPFRSNQVKMFRKLVRLGTFEYSKMRRNIQWPDISKTNLSYGRHFTSNKCRRDFKYILNFRKKYSKELERVISENSISINLNHSLAASPAKLSRCCPSNLKACQPSLTVRSCAPLDV